MQAEVHAAHGCRLAPSGGGSLWWLPWALRCWQALSHAPSSRSGGGGGDATSASLALDRYEVPDGATCNATEVLLTLVLRWVREQW